jgi:hypothetical protein
MNTPEQTRPLPSRVLASIIVCHPLLLLSPMCLLYGIYRAVVAPTLFATDSRNTIFNFIALALYVLMVCATSTLLARKRIIPDAVMLLLLNALLFVAPFILIAHGVFLEGELALALGIMGLSMGMGQLEILKRRLPETFISKQLFAGGAMILLANLSAPIIFRHGLENDNEAWGSVSGYAWNLILPLLVAWLNFLPTQNKSETIWARSWFAPLLYLLWLAGTSIQLWTLAYVDDRHLHGFQFTVALWVLTWTIFRRANLFSPALAPRIERIAIIFALALPALGASDGLDFRIAALLYTLNVPLLALAFGRLPVFALAGVSIVGALACMPVEWMQVLSPSFGRPEFIALIFFAVTLGAFAAMRDARAGLTAAIAVGIGAGMAGYSSAIALNAAILFLFLHQLRWPAIKRDENGALAVIGAAWLWHTLALELTNQPDARIACFTATIVATICLRQASREMPTSLVPPICSIAVLCAHPAHWSIKTVGSAPSGILGIILGFALLAAGAWDSHRRSRQAQTHARN